MGAILKSTFSLCKRIKIFDIITGALGDKQNTPRKCNFMHINKIIYSRNNVSLVLIILQAEYYSVLCNLSQRSLKLSITLRSRVRQAFQGNLVSSGMLHLMKISKPSLIPLLDSFLSYDRQKGKKIM